MDHSPAATDKQYFIQDTALAVAARDAGRPFLVVAESFKRVDADAPPVTETLFETIPNGLVTAFLTDDVFPTPTAG